MMDKQGLTKLVEECGELVQIAAKKSAFMHTDDHPDGHPMKPRMELEISNVLAAIYFVSDKFGLDMIFVQNVRELKLALYQEWDRRPASDAELMYEAERLMDLSISSRKFLTISPKPIEPYAMGNYTYEIDIRPARGSY